MLAESLTRTVLRLAIESVEPLHEFTNQEVLIDTLPAKAKGEIR